MDKRLIKVTLFLATAGACMSTVPSMALAAPSRTYSIDIESIRADIPRQANTIHGHAEKRADHISSYLTIKVGKGKPQSAPIWGPQWIAGNGNAETKNVGQSMRIDVADNDVVTIVYSVIHKLDDADRSTVNADIEKAMVAVAETGVNLDASAMAKGVPDDLPLDLSQLSQPEKNALVASQLVNIASYGAAGETEMVAGGLVGFFAVPAAGAASDWLKKVNVCDGPVAGQRFVTTGAALRKIVPFQQFWKHTERSTATNQHGCGHDSDYQVAWHIHAIE